MHFLPPDIERYTEAHTQPEPPLLARLNRATHLQALYPRMLSGHWQGRLLALLSQLVRPQRILEIGTYTGYATLCLAEGLAPGGTIHTLERDPELAAFARRWFAEAGLAERITVHVGDARTHLPNLATDPAFDLVFLDADKESYLTYYELVLPRLRPGGLLITDNVLWSGQVVDKSATSSALEAIRAFNTCVACDERVERVLVPVRDGLFLIRKR